MYVIGEEVTRLNVYGLSEKPIDDLTQKSIIVIF